MDTNSVIRTICILGLASLANPAALAQDLGSRAGIEYERPVDVRELQRVLGEHGWRVETDVDGSVLLFPGPESAAANDAEPPSDPNSAPPRASGFDSLRGLLQQYGWRVDRDSDGSLLLFPEHTRQPGSHTVVQSPRTPREPAVGSAWHPIEIEDLRDVLTRHGWRVERGPSGDVLLFPTPAPDRAEQGTTTPGNDRQEADTNRLQRLLAPHGWRVARGRDGSLFLYPQGATDIGRVTTTVPQNAPVPPARPTDVASEVSADAPCPCSGVELAALKNTSIELPLASASSVRLLAQAWLDEQGHQDWAVGRIRDVLKVYLVSIVNERPPHWLRNQLVIRKDDGMLFALLP